MKTATFTELRQHAKTYFDAVEEGETVRILRHGKPIADIVPAGGKSGSPSWKRTPLLLHAPGVSLSKTILQEREESDS
jgi:prevent-host-death family protein